MKWNRNLPFIIGWYSLLSSNSEPCDGEEGKPEWKKSLPATSYVISSIWKSYSDCKCAFGVTGDIGRLPRAQQLPRARVGGEEFGRLMIVFWLEVLLRSKLAWTDRICLVHIDFVLHARSQVLTGQRNRSWDDMFKLWINQFQVGLQGIILCYYEIEKWNTTQVPKGTENHSHTFLVQPSTMTSCSTIEPSSPPTRMTTRSKNETAHPGAILRDQRTRQTKEELNEVKRLKNVQMEAKE